MNAIKALGRGTVRLLKVIALIAVIAASATTITAMVLAVLSINPRPPELELVIVLSIAALFIIVASFVATIAHKAIRPLASSRTNGEVFREAMLRFTWLTAPIAGSYGLAKVATEVANILKG